MLKLKLQCFATWCEDLTHWQGPWCWERMKAGGEGDNREWDGWMASPTWWTWVWASSGSWWRTGKPGMFQSMQSLRVRHDWMIAQQSISYYWKWPEHRVAYAKNLFLTHIGVGTMLHLLNLLNSDQSINSKLWVEFKSTAFVYTF